MQKEETEDEQPTENQTEEWDYELSSCPDCGDSLNYKDTHPQFPLTLYCESCGFRAKEHWKVTRTVRTDSSNGEMRETAVSTEESSNA